MIVRTERHPAAPDSGVAGTHVAGMHEEDAA
jgi:hypothetical protein